ncbi:MULTISPECIES: lytic transglycosylase domain-containing protein [Calditerrivibrio]
MKMESKISFWVKFLISIAITIVLLFLVKVGVDYFTFKYYLVRKEKIELEYMKKITYHNLLKNQVNFYNDVINISDYIKRNDFYHNEINNYELALAIVQESYKKKLDPYLVVAIMDVESDFRADSESIKGAKGLMQIKDDTARYIAVKENIKVSTRRINDLLINVKLGISYYSYLLKKFDGNHKYALIAYNIGVNKVYSLMTLKINLPKSYYNKVKDRYNFITKLYQKVPLNI